MGLFLHKTTLNILEDITIEPAAHPKTYLDAVGLVVQQENKNLGVEFQSTPKMYIFTQNQHILVVEWPRTAKTKSWKQILPHFHDFLKAYDGLLSPIYGYVFVWESQLIFEGQIKRVKHLASNFRLNVSTSEYLYASKSFIYPIDKVGELIIPGALRTAVYGESGENEFYNLFLKFKKGNVNYNKIRFSEFQGIFNLKR